MVSSASLYSLFDRSRRHAMLPSGNSGHGGRGDPPLDITSSRLSEGRNNTSVKVGTPIGEKLSHVGASRDNNYI
jgi:hypothetical protein